MFINCYSFNRCRWVSSQQWRMCCHVSKHGGKFHVFLYSRPGTRSRPEVMQRSGIDDLHIYTGWCWSHLKCPLLFSPFLFQKRVYRMWTANAHFSMFLDIWKKIRYIVDGVCYSITASLKHSIFNVEWWYHVIKPRIRFRGFRLQTRRLHCAIQNILTLLAHRIWIPIWS